MTTSTKIANTRNPVIIYRERDHRGRQHLVVRFPSGHKVVEFRRIKALVRWLQDKKHTPFVYDELPTRYRKQLDAGRAEVVHANTKARGHMRMYRPRLGNMCPQLQEFKQHVPKYCAG